MQPIYKALFLEFMCIFRLMVHLHLTSFLLCFFAFPAQLTERTESPSSTGSACGIATKICRAKRKKPNQCVSRHRTL